MPSLMLILGKLFRYAPLFVDTIAPSDLDLKSTKEEIEGGRVSDFSVAREAVQDVRRAVNECYSDVQNWGGEFPYERALSSLQCWKF